uniref:Uncharacterized protein n=1 Tax=Mycena chlorophos TaxID=658473 RepID=A0ABQ0LDJ0_MYCCL|nr:predicted protein [Mycena chlorophos]
MTPPSWPPTLTRSCADPNSRTPSATQTDALCPRYTKGVETGWRSFSLSCRTTTRTSRLPVALHDDDHERDYVVGLDYPCRELGEDATRRGARRRWARAGMSPSLSSAQDLAEVDKHFMRSHRRVWRRTRPSATATHTHTPLPRRRRLGLVRTTASSAPEDDVHVCLPRFLPTPAEHRATAPLAEESPNSNTSNGQVEPGTGCLSRENSTATGVLFHEGLLRTEGVEDWRWTGRAGAGSGKRKARRFGRGRRRAVRIVDGDESEDWYTRYDWRTTLPLPLRTIPSRGMYDNPMLIDTASSGRAPSVRPSTSRSRFGVGEAEDCTVRRRAVQARMPTGAYAAASLERLDDSSSP